RRVERRHLAELCYMRDVTVSVNGQLRPDPDYAVSGLDSVVLDVHPELVDLCVIDKSPSVDSASGALHVQKRSTTSTRISVISWGLQRNQRPPGPRLAKARDQSRRS